MKRSTSDLLNEVKVAAGKYLTLYDETIIEVALAAYVANKLSADPLWIFLCGPPSTAKTEIVGAIDGYDNIKQLSSLTPQTLISGKRKKERETSLLMQLPSQCLIVIKDFTTILTMRHEQKSEILSQLREVYDGKYSKAFGEGHTVSWEGKIGILGAVTTIIDDHTSMSAMLGERFLIYRTGENEHFSAGRAAYNNVFTKSDQRKEFRAKISKFIGHMNGHLKNTREVKDGPKDFPERLISLAIFCAHARTAVPRERDGAQTLKVLPEPEGPGRLINQFLVLATALAIVRGQNQIDEAIYQVIKKTARDTLPRLRLKILETVWNLDETEPYGWHPTKEIAIESTTPASTTVLTLENLHLVRLLERNKDGEAENAPWVWRPSDYMRSLIKVTGALGSES